MSDSPFLQWFVQQHGKRETGLHSSYSDQFLRDAIRRGKEAEAALAERTLWDEKRQSALYAWNVAKDTP